MRKWRSCMTIIGVGSLLFGLLLLVAFIFGYDPVSVSGGRGLNLLILGLFLAGFWGVGAALIYAARRLGKAGSSR